MSTVSVLVEMDFGAGFVDVTPDVVGAIDVRYGIGGSGPLDRVASTGTMRFSLNNSEANSASLLGYYSPGHASMRAGFGIGIKCRLTLTFASVDYVRFVGTIDSIRPMPGIGLERRTHVVVVDWLDYAARWRLVGIPIQLNKRSDQVFSTILGSMPIVPASTSIATGKDTYAYALDNSYAGDSTALSEFQRLAQSELGFIYVVGDSVVFENRHGRMATAMNQFLLDATTDLEASRSRDQILNKVQVVVYPRRADTSPVVLFTSDTPFLVAPGEVVTIRASYTDPTLRAEKVGGTEMVPPVSSASPVQWATAGAGFANVTMTGSTVKKTGGGAAWDAGTYSVQFLTGGDGYVEFTVTDAATRVICGLNSDPAADADYASIDFALFAALGDFQVYESGSLKYTGVGEAAAGVVLRVEVVGGAVKYRANGVLKYTAITPTITYPLYADCSIYTANAEIVSPMISSAVPDYAMNAAADGSGINLTASFSVVAIFGASEVYLTITNNGTQSAYVMKGLQVRGKGVYDYSTVMGEAQDAASIAQYGENVITFDMFYQNDPQHGAQAAAYILNVYKGEGSYIQSVSFPASKSDALMVAALDMDISDRVGIRETVTGLTDDGPGTAVLGHHIQNVALAIETGGVVWCTWGLAPADSGVYWILDMVGRSELDVSTKLGFL